MKKQIVLLTLSAVLIGAAPAIADENYTPEVVGDGAYNVKQLPCDIEIEGKVYTTYVCASEDFKKRGESKIALDDYYTANVQKGEDRYDFCRRMGWQRYIDTMLAVDYLILNRDRHGANMEVLTNRYRKTIRLAPLFDHGVSLFCRCRSIEELEKEDVMADKPVQCFVGSRSAWDNLRLVPRDQFPRLSPLKESDRAYLLDGLDEALDQHWLDRSWEMIWRRWQAYENLRNQG